MKTLQDYILESIENDEVNEGKIWDAVKKWWNNLFEPSDKKYDKYASKMDSETQQEYKQLINDTFDSHNIKIKKIDKGSLEKILKPNNEEPNKQGNQGFWKFVDTKITDNKKDIIFGFIYEDTDIKDTIALLKLNIVSDLVPNFAEIENIQVIDYYNSVFSLDKMIDFIKLNKSKLLNNLKGMFIKKETDKETYEKLVNDCEFVKETINGSINIAKLTV